MMPFFRYFFILSIFLLCIPKGYAKGDLKQYYALSVKATTEICKRNYEGANKLFQSAFEMWDAPFFTDVNNALYAAVRSTPVDSIYINTLLKLSIDRGVDIEKQYGKMETYKCLLKPLLPMLVAHKSAIDSGSFYTLSDAMIRDQSVRDISHKMHQSTFYHPSDLPAIRVIDSVNYIEVCHLLRKMLKNGKNLELEIGYPLVSDVIIILKHASPWRYYNKPLLDSCVKNGVLFAPAIANLFDDFCQSNYDNGRIESNWRKEQNCPDQGLYGSNVTVQFSKSFFIVDIKDSIMNLINQRRTQLFLNDAYANARIVAYAYFYGNEGFLYPGVEVIPDRDFERSYEQILKDKGIKFILYRGKEDYDYYRKW